MKWFSPQSYAFSIMLINEFEGAVYTCNDEELARHQGVCPFTSGDEYLRVVYDINSM